MVFWPLVSCLASLRRLVCLCSPLSLRSGTDVLNSLCVWPVGTGKYRHPEPCSNGLLLKELDSNTMGNRTNGFSTMFAAAVSYGLGQINGSIASWRILFIFVGLLTVISAPVTYFVLDNDVTTARFFTEHERLQAIERLRANNTGTGSREFKWSQAFEALIE